MANIASMKARASTQALYICKREHVFVVYSLAVVQLRENQ